MIDINTAKIVIWGLKTGEYNSFRHIHEAWYRAFKFKFPNRNVQWLDEHDDICQIDFSNTLFITVNVANLSNMPKRKDCFYAIHNLDNTAKVAFDGDFSGYSVMNYGLYTSTTELKDEIEVGHEMFFFSQLHAPYSCLILRWGTDLFPHEIETNKPTQVFNKESKEINFIGTIYPDVHGPFKRACLENGINFNAYGGYSGQAPVSIQENQWLVRSSHMAPAIGDNYHSRVGYSPCRVYKNISYGCMPLVNNPHVQRLFKDRLIFNEDTYQLFYDAKNQLPNIELDVLHQLMDEVSRDHTYVSKIDGLMRAVQLTQEARS